MKNAVSWTSMGLAVLVLAGPSPARGQERPALRVGFLAGSTWLPHDVSVSGSLSSLDPEGFAGQGAGSFDPRGLGGLEVGYRLDGRLELEGYALLTEPVADVTFALDEPFGEPPTEIDTLEARAVQRHTWLWGVNANLFLYTDGRLQPFVSGGVGAVGYRNGGVADDLTTTVGVGLLVPVARHWSVRVVGRDVLSTYSGLPRSGRPLEVDLGDGVKHQLLLATGLSFHF